MKPKSQENQLRRCEGPFLCVREGHTRVQPDKKVATAGSGPSRNASGIPKRQRVEEGKKAVVSLSHLIKSCGAVQRGE